MRALRYSWKLPRMTDNTHAGVERGREDEREGKADDEKRKEMNGKGKKKKYETQGGPFNLAV